MASVDEGDNDGGGCSGDIDGSFEANSGDVISVLLLSQQWSR